MSDDKDARVAALEAELAERTRERDELEKAYTFLADFRSKLGADFTAERERREAAEIALRMIRIDAAWAIDAKQQVLAHFARFKD